MVAFPGAALRGGLVYVTVELLYKSWDVLLDVAFPFTIIKTNYEADFFL